MKTLLNATPPTGKIYLLEQIALTFEPVQWRNLYVLQDLECPIPECPQPFGHDGSQKSGEKKDD